MQGSRPRLTHCPGALFHRPFRAADLGLCREERLAERRELVVDDGGLEPAAVRSQALVQRDRVPLGVLPVGDAGRDLPVGLVCHRHRTGRRVHHGHRGGPWAARNPAGGGGTIGFVEKYEGLS
jgi:hypothetical protein